MKILVEGKKHEKMAWFTKCNTCESELRIIEGDPMAGDLCYNCDASQYYIRYICPVCYSKNEAHTRSSFGIEANAKYEKIILNEEDRKEMAEWILPMDILENADFMMHLTNRCRV